MSFLALQEEMRCLVSQHAESMVSCAVLEKCTTCALDAASQGLDVTFPPFLFKKRASVLLQSRQLRLARVRISELEDQLASLGDVCVRLDAFKDDNEHLRDVMRDMTPRPVSVPSFLRLV